MKPSITLLKEKHGSAPVAILGGGPSLPNDLKRLPDNAVLIGVNHHYTKLTAAQYCVFMDHPKPYGNNEFNLINTLATLNDTIKISQYIQYSDYVLDANFWDGGFSSTLATWLGSYISSGPVLLCGMDCYQNGNYFYKLSSEMKKLLSTRPQYKNGIEPHLKAWRPALTHIEKPERIKAMSGPLIELFGGYEAQKT